MNFLELTVSELSKMVGDILDSSLPYLKVTGEVIGMKVNQGSGHWYFNLTDGKSTVNMVCFANISNKMSFIPLEGEKIVVFGRITTYKRSSTYQVLVTSMEKFGVGEVVQKLEKLKKKLLEEGLFDESKKKSLPFAPRVVGVITSPTGSVIEDIKATLLGRLSPKVLLYPSTMQGAGAPSSVISGLEYFNNLLGGFKNSAPELIIIARGGGSFEDLFCFNDEALVRAISKSSIPVISAIGHETDYTLSDFVADVRAPTPTAAAKIASLEKGQILQRIELARYKMQSIVSRFLEEMVRKLEVATTRMLSVLGGRCGFYANRLNGLYVRILSKAEMRAGKQVGHLNYAKRRFTSLSTGIVDTASRKISGYRKAYFGELRRLDRAIFVLYRLLAPTQKRLRLFSALQLHVNHRNNRLGLLRERFGSIDPTALLKRGFALVLDGEGKIVRSVNEAPMNMRIKLQDGEILVTKSSLF